MHPAVARRSSNDPDEVVEHLKPVAPEISIRPLSKDFSFDAKITRLTSTGLLRIQMSRTNIRQGPRPYVSITVPLRGSFSVRRNRKYVKYVPGTAHVLSPDEPFDYLTGTGPVLVANIDRALVVKTARKGPGMPRSSQAAVRENLQR